MAYTTGGKRVDALRGFRFHVTTAEVELRCGFNKVSGLSNEIEQAEYREGCDAATVQKLPGLMTYEDITLERGLSFDSGLHNWMAEVVKGDISHTALPDNIGVIDFRRTLIIKLHLPYVKGENGARRWEAINAWPKKMDDGELDAQSSEVVIESIDIAHEGFTRGAILGGSLVNYTVDFVYNAAKKRGSDF